MVLVHEEKIDSRIGKKAEIDQVPVKICYMVNHWTQVDFLITDAMTTG